jgi:hypothetical protein
MNIIKEKREDIILNNNTAQKQIESILESVVRSNNELKFEEPLHGDIDLSLLKELGFGNVKSIVFVEGEITSIINLPDGLMTLECPNNLMVQLDELPGSLTHLKISGNYLTNIIVKDLKYLETLVVSNNKIIKLENLPETIKELKCDNNQIENLDLNGLGDLKILNVSNNKITLIENLPEGLIDFKMENTPSIEFRNSAVPVDNEENVPDVKKNYAESLNEYFYLKNTYEVKLKKMKKTAYASGPSKKLAREAVLSVKPQCINCKRPVGTLFSRKDNKYTAICGDSATPCKLNIQIFNGGYANLTDQVELYKEGTDSLKDKIINLKLNTLFNYIEESISVRIFKKRIEEYNEDSSNFKLYLDKYNELYNNNDKKALIIKKQNSIFFLTEKIRGLLDEYVKTDNKEFLKVAVRMQVNELFPEVRNLRTLNNEIMEMIDINDKESAIFKYPVFLSNLDYNYGEEERVMSFVK